MVSMDLLLDWDCFHFTRFEVVIRIIIMIENMVKNVFIIMVEH